MASSIPAEEVLAFIREEFLEPSKHIEVGTSLISSGIVDSFSMASLKAYIEERSGVRIPDSEATAQAFDSVESILALIDRLKSSAG
jgi:acyl carrier protein